VCLGMLPGVFVAGNNRMKIATRIIISLLCFAGAVFFYFQAKQVFCRQVSFILEPSYRCGTLGW
ncbi:hypothetical protein K5M49_22685, partial [Serratia marcescens]|nr:hypothetical protein [Serratia marcescens]